MPSVPDGSWNGDVLEQNGNQRIELANELVLTLPSFGRWVSSIWNSVTPFGQVSHRQVAILWLIRYRTFLKGGTATPSNFADTLSVRRSVVTRVLASLESGGFITRIADPDDGRSQIIEITERGYALSVYIEEIFHQEMMGSIDFVSDDELDLLLCTVPLLKRISANLETARKQRVALEGENPHEEAGL